MLDTSGILNDRTFSTLERLANVNYTDETVKNAARLYTTATGNNIMHHILLYAASKKDDQEFNNRFRQSAFYLFLDYPKLINQKNKAGYTPLVFALLSDDLASIQGSQNLEFYVIALIQSGADISEINKFPKAQARFEKLLKGKYFEMMVAQSLMLSAYMAVPDSVFEHYEESVNLHFKFNKSETFSKALELTKSFISPHRHPKIVAMHKNLRTVKDAALKARNQEIPQEENFDAYRYAAKLSNLTKGIPNLLFCFSNKRFFNHHKTEKEDRIRKYIFRDLKRAGLDYTARKLFRREDGTFDFDNALLAAHSASLNSDSNQIFYDTLKLYSKEDIEAEKEDLKNFALLLSDHTDISNPVLLFKLITLCKVGVIDINFHCQNRTLDRKEPILFHAIETDDDDITDSVIKAGAEINYQSIVDGTTPLILFCKSRYCSDYRIIDNLLEVGADINIPDSSGKTAIDYLLERNWTDPVSLSFLGAEIVSKLLEHGAKINPEIVKKYRRYLVAFISYTFGHGGSLSIIKALEDVGIELNYSSLDAPIALKDAFIYYNTPEAVEYLLENVYKDQKPNFDERYLQSLLQNTICSNKVWAIKYFVQFGADFQAQLAYACMNNCTAPMIKALIESGADPYYKDEHGKIALYYALKNKPEAVEYLLENVYKDQKPNFDERSLQDLLLHAVRSEEKSWMFKYLVQFGADLNNTELLGCTIIERCINRFTINMKFLKALIDNGANVNTRDSVGRNLLALLALKREREDTIEATKLLLANGADPNLTFQIYERNYTALSIALSPPRNYTIAKILARFKKTDLNVLLSEEYNTTLLMYAARRNDAIAVEILLENGADSKLKNNIRQSIAIEMTSSPEIVRKFIEFDPSFKEDNELLKRMFVRHGFRHPEMANFLIKEIGVDINTPSRDRFNDQDTTILINAVLFPDKNVDYISFLIEECKADINYEIPRRGNALTIAATYNNMQNVKCLIDHGADINAIVTFYHPILSFHDHKHTALSIAIMEGELDRAQQLIDLGASLEGECGRIALRHAVGSYYSKEAFSFLSEKGLKHTCTQYLEDCMYFTFCDMHFIFWAIAKDAYSFCYEVAAGLDYLSGGRLSFTYNICKDAILAVYSTCLRSNQEEKELG